MDTHLTTSLHGTSCTVRTALTTSFLLNRINRLFAGRRLTITAGMARVSGVGAAAQSMPRNAGNKMAPLAPAAAAIATM